MGRVLRRSVALMMHMGIVDKRRGKVVSTRGMVKILRVVLERSSARGTVLTGNQSKHS